MVSAATLSVAISAPIFGAITERLARKHVIVFSILGVAIPTLLAATSTSLLGSMAAGILSGAFWALCKRAACAAFIVAMQIIALVISVAGWRTPVVVP